MLNQASGNLSYNLLLFGRLLRGLGLDVDTGRMIELLQALGDTDITNKTDFYYTLRGLLVHRREDIPPFDAAFAAFWRKPVQDRGRLIYSDAQVRRPPKPALIPAPLRPLGLNLEPPEPEPTDEPPLIEATFTYSSR